ncbi:hypothetical protein ACF8QD_00580 [Aeromonas media]|uniref:hypothetical protein n=1 Tax=Aeromonas media TaxID=651 RepID=UPI00370A9409
MLTEIKVWLDVAYLLSGPVIAVIAYLALGQIRIAKAQIEEQRNALRVTSKRDALKLTSEQVTLYCDKIIPLQNVFYKKMRDEGVDVFDKFGVEFDSESIKLIPPGEQVDIEVLGKFVTEFVNVANAMESFSTYFMSGVADEEVAYLSLGSTFCSTMKTLAPLLIPMSNDERRFAACLSLYQIWGMRRENEALQKQKLEIESKLNSKQKMSIRVMGDES